jgi:hypothetical protein
MRFFSAASLAWHFASVASSSFLFDGIIMIPPLLVFASLSNELSFSLQPV